MRKKVYIAHPYDGLEHNKINVENIIKDLIKKHDDVLFISPIHLFGYLYYDVPYEEGMEYCLEILKECDELWLCKGWEGSRGCCMEFDYATEHCIPIKFM